MLDLNKLKSTELDGVYNSLNSLASESNSLDKRFYFKRPEIFFLIVLKYCILP